MTNLELSKNITIEYGTKEIIISKQFSNKAKRFGTDEYNTLLEAKRDFPTFEVKVKTISRVNKKRDYFKGLTYDYMESYILAHDTKRGSKYKEFITLLPSRAFDYNKEDSVVKKDKSYAEVKKWFLETYNFTNKEVA